MLVLFTLLRFIPACAGNRPSPAVAAFEAPVHPRVCGEQLLRHQGETLLDGSSPRVRGTGWHPAIEELVTAVHPRVCGEQAASRPGLTPRAGSSPRVRGTGLAGNGYNRGFSGSSPRVRGTVPRGSRAPVARRFIPACAGNRSRWWRAPAATPVHPRVCGEQTLDDGTVVEASGSSPRVRGTGLEQLPAEVADRFIPACAGNRLLPSA